jgi:hypothetical protein
MQCRAEQRSKILRAQLVKNCWQTIRYLAPGALLVLALMSCEGKHRPYELPMQQDAAADTRALLPPSTSAFPDGAGGGSSSENLDIGTAPVSERPGNPPLDQASADEAAASGAAAESAPAALGANCSAPADCASGFCALGVDGVGRCCDRACNTTPCERCSAGGSCGALPIFAQECPEVSCPLDNVCQDFEQSIAAGICQDTTRCATASDCSFDWKPVAREGQACACSEDGCTLLVGEGCTRDADCASGACRPTLAGMSLCCAQGCGPGQVCRADGSGCELEPACANGQTRCSSSSFQTCVAGQWSTQRECGALGCDLAVGGCRREAGQACTTSADCGEGACRSTATGARICCTAACDTACKLCAASGTSCQQLADDAACGTIPCPASTTCRNSPVSVTTNRCIAGNCGNPEALCGGTARNSGASCSATFLCDDAGNCSVPKEQRALGQSCGAASQVCTQGSCTAGRCCPAGCPNGCLADGTCNCPTGATLQNGSCVCGPRLNQCTNGASTTCNNNVFGFEDGTTQGWEAFGGTVPVGPVLCGDAFASCLVGDLRVSNAAGFAHGGTFFVNGSGALADGSARRLSAVVTLCGARGSRGTTNLVGQTIGAFMQTGSQGGSAAGNVFSIAISDGSSPPVVIGTTDAATSGVARNTGWRLVSGVVPNSALGRAVRDVILSLEVAPGTTFIDFQIDDVELGD